MYRIVWKSAKPRFRDRFALFFYQHGASDQESLHRGGPTKQMLISRNKSDVAEFAWNEDFLIHIKRSFIYVFFSHSCLYIYVNTMTYGAIAYYVIFCLSIAK